MGKRERGIAEDMLRGLERRMVPLGWEVAMRAAGMPWGGVNFHMRLVVTVAGEQQVFQQSVIVSEQALVYAYTPSYADVWAEYTANEVVLGVMRILAEDGKKKGATDGKQEEHRPEPPLRGDVPLPARPGEISG